MLRGLVICPDTDLAEKLSQALTDSNQVSTVRDLDRYPSEIEFMRLVRAHAPHVLFLSIESLPKAIEMVRIVEREVPGLQMVAISRTCEPSVLLDVMRAGIREFISLPFGAQVVYETLMRVEEQAERKPAVVDATDQLYAFLPSKQGVGTSTVALERGDLAFHQSRYRCADVGHGPHVRHYRVHVEVEQCSLSC